MIDNNHLEQEHFINSIIKMREEKYNLDTNLISDGQHTFGELYHARATLFALFVFNYMDLTSQPGKADDFYCWKSKLHSDGTMYDDYFIVGCTRKSDGKFFSYHYHLAYWDFFDCDEIPNSPEWSKDKELTLDTLGYYFVPNYAPYNIIEARMKHNGLV